MAGTAKSIAGRCILSLFGFGLALAASGPAMAQAVVATGVGTPFELAFWQSIDNSNDASLYDAYLAHFPNGTFAEIAHAKIVSLHGRVAPAATPALTVPVSTAAVPFAVPAGAPLAQQPVPAAVRVMQPAVAVVQPTAAVMPVAASVVLADPVVATPAVVMATPQAGTPQPATPQGGTPQPGTLGQLLAALASSQTSDGGAASANGASQPASLQSATLISGPAPIVAAPIAPRQTAVSFAMPMQPALYAVPAVALPPSFCSAEQRNAFHDQIYTPSVNTARHNNEAAAGYLRQLQALYDQYQLSRDPDTMNAIVVAARAYEQVAQTTYSMQAGLVRQFGALMAVPVVPCAQQAQPSAGIVAR